MNNTSYKKCLEENLIPSIPLGSIFVKMNFTLVAGFDILTVLTMKGTVSYEIMHEDKKRLVIV
jgi:hypothetical protein